MRRIWWEGTGGRREEVVAQILELAALEPGSQSGRIVKIA